MKIKKNTVLNLFLILCLMSFHFSSRSQKFDPIVLEIDPTLPKHLQIGLDYRDDVEYVIIDIKSSLAIDSISIMYNDSLIYQRKGMGEREVHYGKLKLNKAEYCSHPFILSFGTNHKIAFSLYSDRTFIYVDISTSTPTVTYSNIKWRNE